jgi:hypothetical protein
MTPRQFFPTNRNTEADQLLENLNDSSLPVRPPPAYYTGTCLDSVRLSDGKRPSGNFKFSPYFSNNLSGSDSASSVRLSDETEPLGIVAPNYSKPPSGKFKFSPHFSIV